MEKKQNNAFLLMQWIPVVVFASIFLIGMGVLLRNGSYLLVIFSAGIMGVVIGWAYIIYTNTFSQINRLLQSDSPQPFIDFYEKRLGRASLSNQDATLAFSKSLAYTLYGYFDSAKTEVDKINWEQKTPMFQAQKVYIQALWAYLEMHDFQQGSILAKEARRLTEISSAFPGANVSINTFDAAVEIGELLSGNSDPTIVTRLETKFKQLPILTKVIVAWGLEGFYNQSGQIERARNMRDLLTRFAPHCKGLASL